MTNTPSSGEQKPLLNARKERNEKGEITFRSAKRESNIRSIIFMFECILVLGAYLYALTSLPAAGDRTWPTQRILLATYGCVYMLRLNLMSCWLLQRELAIEEMTFVILVWVPAILASFVFAARPTDSKIILILSLILYLTGSYLNSYSEYERKIWKQRPSSKGRAYMDGLFSLSRNINYFGDTMLFGGWALATASWINVWVPLLMGSTFWFYHIPDKEKYLAEKYARDWPTYVEKTPYAFIPWVC